MTIAWPRNSLLPKRIPMSHTTLPLVAKDLLSRMLRAQAYRELGAMGLIESARQFAPNEADARALDSQFREEHEHLQGALKVWSELTGASLSTLRQQAEDQLQDKPLPAITGWIDFATALFVYDRAGFYQLQILRTCRYEPYARLVVSICAEEAEHQAAGARAVVQQVAQDPERAQESLNRWLPVALTSFGRPNSPASDQALALGLKSQPPTAVMRAFLDSLKPTLEASGLKLPTLSMLRACGIQIPESALRAPNT